MTRSKCNVQMNKKQWKGEVVISNTVAAHCGMISETPLSCAECAVTSPLSAGESFLHKLASPGVWQNQCFVCV